MTREELIEKTRACSELAHELYNEGIIGTGPTGGGIQCTDEAFANIAKSRTCTVTDRITEEYPLEISVNIGDLKFYARGTETKIEAIKEQVKSNATG